MKKNYSRILSCLLHNHALVRMIQFYDIFPDFQISATLSQQLTWSHIVVLLPLSTQDQRDFYAYMAIEGNWSVRQLN